MNPFKNRREDKKQEKEEKEQLKLDKLMEDNNLQDLSQEDKETVQHILKQTLTSSFMGLGFSAEDTAKTGLARIMIDQNLMVIKLLNDISNKLDK